MLSNEASCDESQSTLSVESSSYRRPAAKSLSSIIRQDADDESLRKYKEALLGENPTGIEIYPEDPRKVIIRKLAIVVDGRHEMELDLSGDLSKLKNHPLTIKEGSLYCVKIYFYVQRDIVTGLKYGHETLRNDTQVDEIIHMVGSFGPKKGLQSYTTPEEEAPAGSVSRGQYHIKSFLTDDDKNDFVSWEWLIEIKRDWE